MSGSIVDAEELAELLGILVLLWGEVGVRSGGCVDGVVDAGVLGLLVLVLVLGWRRGADGLDGVDGN